ncbi:MAG: DUF1211 domain-containing protein [Verrucomicrobia bacterium]|nr:DUF1211 domain-containing protein [Verrucomicrobiota bacterium]
MLVCIWCVAHHHLFNVLKRSDRGLLWLNSLFLLRLAFLPFPTALWKIFLPNESRSWVMAWSRLWLGFVIDTGAHANIPAVPAPQAHFKVAEDAVKLSLEQKEQITLFVNGKG